MAITLQEFQQRVNNRFPDKDYRVLEFDGLKHPITILCPIHGKQRLSTAHNLINSKQGCPECAKESSGSAAKVRQQAVYSDLRKLGVIAELAASPMEDFEFKTKVSEILEDYNRQLSSLSSPAPEPFEKFKADYKPGKELSDIADTLETCLNDLISYHSPIVNEFNQHQAKFNKVGPSDNDSVMSKLQKMVNEVELLRNHIRPKTN
nr:MAG TPA: Protein of unknown function (DUF723) [Caudoviricetes sp.]